MSNIRLASSAKVMAWSLFLVLSLFTIGVALSPILGRTFSVIIAIIIMWLADGYLSYKWPQIFPSKVKSGLSLNGKSKALTFLATAALMIVMIILIRNSIGDSAIQALLASLVAIGVLLVVLNYLDLRK